MSDQGISFTPAVRLMLLCQTCDLSGTHGAPLLLRDTPNFHSATHQLLRRVPKHYESKDLLPLFSKFGVVRDIICLKVNVGSRHPLG